MQMQLSPGPPLRVQTRLDEGLPLSSLAPDGHYLKTFIDLNDQFDQSSGAPSASLQLPLLLRIMYHTCHS